MTEAFLHDLACELQLGSFLSEDAGMRRFVTVLRNRYVKGTVGNDTKSDHLMNFASQIYRRLQPNATFSKEVEAYIRLVETVAERHWDALRAETVGTA